MALYVQKIKEANLTICVYYLIVKNIQAFLGQKPIRAFDL